MKKKLLSFVLSFALLFGTAAALPERAFNDGTGITASAANTATSGKCGENVSWSLDGKGVLTISGKGKMNDYSYSSYDSNINSPFVKRTDIKSVVIKSGVTSIGRWAFYDCSSLTSVTIPSSVTSIGDDAFDSCSSLTSITIPSSVTSIGDYAFYYCKSLESITIPSSVTSIGDAAFYYCSSLTSVTIPSSVTSIGSDTFRRTKWLENQQKENPLVVVNGILIDGTKCSGKVTIPSSVTSIGDGAFSFCEKLTSITIPSSVTSIGDGAFSSCGKLTSITIPSSVTSIGDGAFRWCSSLTSVTIPSSVTSIGDKAFGYNSDGSKITKIDGFTVYGKTGSAAEKYANENGFKFVYLTVATRLSGSSRYETAAKIADEVKAQGSVDRVFLVNADKFADALAGVPLAVNQNAAILLASKTELPDATLAEIKKLGVKNITILGGNSAVGKEAVEDKLTKQGYIVTRIKGSTRYETATNIAEKVNSAPTAVFVVYSQKFPDALGISSIAAKMKAPILYVDKKGTIDANTKAYLTKHKATIKKAYVIGGKGAVSDDVKSQVDKTLGITSVRISGSTRYETCTNVLQYSDFKSYVNGNAICVTTGEKFPDALAGGILAAKTNAPVLLVNKTLDATQKAYLAKKKAETSGGIASVYILGGKSAVPEAVKDAIYNAVK